MSDPPQITLLDLDSAGLDPAEPCPPEFMDFLYQNSQDGYLTLWSHILAEPNGTSRIQKWIDDGLAEYHARTIQTQMAPPTPEKPEGEHITEITYPEGSTEPPVNVDVPLVYGDATVGGTLTCTMGNWDNTPTSYAYVWSSGGTENTYTVLASDAGTSITCVVTATNNAGSTAAAPSNAVEISGAMRDAGSERTVPRREYPKEDR